MRYFITVGDRTTISREADSDAELHSGLVKEFGEGVSLTWSAHGEPRLPITDWEAEGRRIALEGMDLPDGAYLAMAEELGIDPL